MSMMFMNEWDIREARDQYAAHPVLGAATQTLVNLQRWANSNSDGWAYWPKPARAAKSLMQLIQGDDAKARYDCERADATTAKLKVALRPIKAFRTRHDADFEILEA